MLEQFKKDQPGTGAEDGSGEGSNQGPEGRIISNDVRHNLIAEAAYYRAQRRGFQNGDPVEDWLAAEAEIDEQLSEPIRRPSSIVLKLENSW
jgi:hypothetical protein